MRYQPVLLLLLLFLLLPFSVSAAETLTDKTLVVWAQPTDLHKRGGSALTVDMANPDAFDAVVYAELEPGVWMPGSSGYKRTQKEQKKWTSEVTSAKKSNTNAETDFVRLVVVYRGKQVEFYRNAALVTSYEFTDPPQSFDETATILFGPRHVAQMKDYFVGRIKEARIYATALTKVQLEQLQPGKPLADLQPWAWWDFSTTGVREKTGRFNDIMLSGDVGIEKGALTLGPKKGILIARKSSVPSAQKMPSVTQWLQKDGVPPSALESARCLREKFLADPFRPTWHFTPPEDNARPGDPNGCFFANGQYHLMYLYNRTGSGFCWGHITSIDLVHWRHHEDAIGPGNGDDGCFSGGGFLDDDGTAYLTYWMLWGDKGIGIAKSQAPYEHWTKLPENPVIRSTEFGISEIKNKEGKMLVYGSADPSNIWKKEGKYYMLTGNLPVLNKYGRKPNAPEEQKGDRLYLFVSKNLTQWDYKGIFYQRHSEWTDGSEDNMCPSFLPLPNSPDGGKAGAKHLLLFISHNKGCQYYIGTYDKNNDRFLPDSHGRMTRVDNTFFAPEALIDGKGRQIIWAWLIDNRPDEMRDGWSGVYGLPRTVWLGPDQTLRMKPVPELESLHLNEKVIENISVASNQPIPLQGITGDSCEMEITVSANELVKAKKVGVIVRQDLQQGEKTLLYYDRDEKTLVFDSRAGGPSGRPALESLPLNIPDNEPLILRVFIDHSVIEVYANDRQAICRRVYPTAPNKALGISLWVEGKSCTIEKVRSWEMAPANPF